MRAHDHVKQEKEGIQMTRPMIIDISEWQSPAQINYALLAQQIDHVIIRVQYGSAHCDKFYQTHLQHFQKIGIPTAVYAWVRGINHEDMAQEARVFFERAKTFQPTFYWLDVEEQSMKDLRGGVEIFRQTLKQLSGQKVGLYVAHHLYAQFNLAVENFDALWLPSYGTNSGSYQGIQPTVNKNYDLHQYTSKGRLPGYGDALDLNRLSGRKPLNFFTANSQQTAAWGIAEKGTFTLNTAIHLRTAPNPQAQSIAVLQAGQTIHYEAFAHERTRLCLASTKTSKRNVWIPRYRSLRWAATNWSKLGNF